MKRKRKQTGGANGNRFLEYDCKIKTFVALYLTATYTDPPPSVSPDAAADGGGGGGDGVAAEGNDDATTYLQEKGILIPLQGGRYGYASSVNFGSKLVEEAMDYCKTIQFKTFEASEAAAKDDDDGDGVDGGGGGGGGGAEAPGEEKGGIIYNHIAHQYNEVWGKLTPPQNAAEWLEEVQKQTEAAT